MTATEGELLDIFASEAIIDRALLKREATLDELGIASLDIISVMFEIENRYGLVIEEGDLPITSTLGEVIDYTTRSPASVTPTAIRNANLPN